MFVSGRLTTYGIHIYNLAGYDKSAADMVTICQALSPHLQVLPTVSLLLHCEPQPIAELALVCLRLSLW
jgi:hypothetical protein